MSIDTLEFYFKCPFCGETNTYYDYHENTSSERCEWFNFLNRNTLTCKFCSSNHDMKKSSENGLCSGSNINRYKKLFKDTLIYYCTGQRCISFSDWREDVTEQPALDHLCMMYPLDEELKFFNQIYRCVRLFGKSYLNELKTRDKIVTRKYIRLPECLSMAYLYEGVEEIEESAFANCISLKEIVLPNTLCKIKKEAFRNSGLKNIKIPPCAKLGEQVFKDCSSLRTVELPMCMFAENMEEYLGLCEKSKILWYE